MRWMLLEKKRISSAFPLEDYPGHVTFSLIPEASAVPQLHGYHVWVCEGNHNRSTLGRWAGSRYSTKMPSESFEKGYASACDSKSQPVGWSLKSSLPWEFLLKKHNMICSPLLPRHYFTPELINSINNHFCIQICCFSRHFLWLPCLAKSLLIPVGPQQTPMTFVEIMWAALTPRSRITAMQ